MKDRIKSKIQEIFTDVKPTKYQVEGAFLEMGIDTRLVTGSKVGTLILWYVKDNLVTKNKDIIDESLQYWLPLGTNISIVVADSFTDKR